jgi:hypothetical protein
MKRKTLAIVLLFLSLFVPAGARSAASCNDRIRMATPTSRFTVNGDGTVTDKKTKLTWQRCPMGMVLDDGGTPGVLGDDRCLPAQATTFTWGAALRAAQQVNASGGFAGASDWRVPNRKELLSIVETACTFPALNTQVFPEPPPGQFLSSTTYSSVPHLVWATDFGTGGETLPNKSDALSVRLVRG